MSASLLLRWRCAAGLVAGPPIWRCAVPPLAAVSLHLCSLRLRVCASRADATRGNGCHYCFEHVIYVDSYAYSVFGADCVLSANATDAGVRG